MGFGKVVAEKENKLKKYIILFFAMWLMVFIGFKIYKLKNFYKSEINIITPALPYSADPMDYDSISHHIAFTSVFGTLVTQVHNNEFKGLISDSWSHSQDFQEWKFNINEKLTFSNGEHITAKSVLLNFKRVAYLKKINKSKSGFFEFVEGFERFNNLSGELSGLKLNNSEVIIKFIKPMPQLLDRISFGIYSIVHPSQFNSENGNWLNLPKNISSNAYFIDQWDDSKFTLKLRNDFNPLKLVDRIQKINIHESDFLKHKSDLVNIDYIYGDSTYALVDDTFEFFPNMFLDKVGYIHCFGWNKKNRPMSNVGFRKYLREKFYSNLAKQNFKVTTSFLPLTIPGVEEFKRDSLEKLEFSNVHLITQKIGNSYKFPESKKKVPAEIFRETIAGMALDANVDLQYKNLMENSDFNDFDFLIRGTDIDYETPINDLKFMFLSKESIKLPDETGRIIKLLGNDNIDFQAVNKEIWDQAIIWPLRHYKSGIWLNTNSKLSNFNINKNVSLFDFQFLKWK